MINDFDDVKSDLLLGDDSIHYDISVVIPTYNRKKSLLNLVENVCVQQINGFTTNIVICDNSEIEPDGLVSYLDALAEKYGLNILYYRNRKNINMFPNWNRVVSLANCDYACMMHSDDIMLQGCLQHMWDKLKELPKECALMVDNYRAAYDDISTIWIPKKRNFSQRILKLMSFLGYKCHDVHNARPIDFIAKCASIVPAGFVISKELFIKSGGWSGYADSWPDDLEYVLKLSQEHLLYCSDWLYVVKRGRDYSRKRPISIDVAIPYVYVSYHIQQYYLNKLRFLPFKKLLIMGRLLGNAYGGFALESDMVKYVLPHRNLSVGQAKIYDLYTRILTFFYLLR